MNKKMRRLVAGAAMALATTGCFDLSVGTTFDDLTREAVIADPVLIETVIASTGVNIWAAIANVGRPWAAMEVMGERTTSSTDVNNIWNVSREPRQALENQVGTSNVNTTAWALLYEANSSAAEMGGLVRREDIRLIDPATNNDNTTRALAWARFVQGTAHGYLSIIYDRAAIVHENVDLSEVPLLPLAEYTEVRDSALKWLNEAAVMAETNTFVFPYTNALWFWNTSMSNNAFAEVIHSIIARVMVYSARSPAERDAVNWGNPAVQADLDNPETVVYHLARSIRTDFGPGADGSRPNTLLSYEYKQMTFAAAATCNNCSLSQSTRVDLRLLGPADTTRIDVSNPPDGIRDVYQYTNWLEAVSTQEGRDVTPGFVINSPDARIGTPESNPDESGRPITFRFTDAAITNSAPGAGTPMQPPERGLYYRESNYFSRSMTNNGNTSSGQLDNIPEIGIRVVEMDLLRAEAAYRAGDFDAAAAIVNNTRVNRGGLPAVDEDGPPNSTQAEIDACVPRRYDGSCGDLWDALMYEKRIETYGSHGLIPWADGRGWGCLLAGTLTELPIPARQLDLMGEPNYTFGGQPGQRGSAPAPTNCPMLFNPAHTG